MKRNKTTLKSYFQTGDIPTQGQYENLIDSLVHVDDVIPSANLDPEVAKKNEDNQFSSQQTFSDGINVNGTGESTFNNPLVLNDTLTVTQGGVDITGESYFEDRLEANSLIDATAGLRVQSPWTPLDVAGQPTGSILLANNSSGTYSPTIGGKTDNNSPGLQFIASTRDASGTLADMIFNVRENNNTDFTTELNTVGFQFRRYSTPLINIYRNGKQENLFGLDVHGQANFNDEVICGSSATASIFFVDYPSGWLVKNTAGNHGVYFDGTETSLQSNGVFSVRADGTTVNLRNTYVNGFLNVLGAADLASDGTDGSEVLRLNLDGGRDWVFKQKGSGAGTSLELRSTQHKDYYHYSTASLFRSSTDDSSHLTLNHSSKTADLVGTLTITDQLTLGAGIEVNQTISTPTGTNLFLLPSGGGQVYFGNAGNGNKMYQYSNLNDGNYTIFDHTANQTSFGTTHVEGFLFNKKVEVIGSIKPSGGYISSDGTAGYTGTFTAGTYSITVKDGIITDAVDIS